MVSLIKVRESHARQFLTTPTVHCNSKMNDNQFSFDNEWKSIVNRRKLV